MREGGLDAPIRHPIPWQDLDFTDEVKLDAELRRVFDVCHGCRRCFNLCDSFPRLFNLLDESKTGELDSVDSKDFKSIIDACTLCDMCFMTKCPYVPPHEFNLDFPHLMLRYRAMELQKGRTAFMDRQLTETDRNGKIGCCMSGVANWATQCGNRLTRNILQSVAGIHKDAVLPNYASKTFANAAQQYTLPVVNTKAPGYGRKVVIYSTCFTNYNNPKIGLAALGVLHKNGVETKIIYPECCGMPQLEHGDFIHVANKAQKIAATMVSWIDKGYSVIALVPSCALMLKFEWPLIVPDDKNVEKLSQATFDISEYIVDIANNEGIVDGMTPLDGDISVHIACHARAQNMGQKATQMLRLLPETKVNPIERCSGHGGSWGVKKEFFATGIKVGKPVARQAVKNKTSFVVSECPLAREHIIQGIKIAGEDASKIQDLQHPIQLIAHAYGIST